MRTFFRADLTRPALVLAVLLATATAGALPGSTQAVTDVVLCSGKTFDGYDKVPIVLKGSVAADPNRRKIIRNCTFRDASMTAIRLTNARNVLIEGSLFENLRTRVAGSDLTAIGIIGTDVVDNVVIRTSTFRSIGSDAIQIGAMGRSTSNITIADSRFYGSEAVGENAIDVKGTYGPVRILRNVVQGFRACQRTQDCSGSGGVGVVVHSGSNSGRANNVYLEGNTFRDNGPSAGLVVSEADNVRIASNRFEYNFNQQLIVRPEAGTCAVGLNVFLGSGSTSVSGCSTIR